MKTGAQSSRFCHFVRILKDARRKLCKLGMSLSKVRFTIIFLSVCSAEITYASERFEILCAGNETKETTYMTKSESVIDVTRESESRNNTYVINGNNIVNTHVGTKEYKCKSSMNSIECTFEHGPGLRLLATTGGQIRIDRSAGTVYEWTVRFLHHKGGNFHRTITSFNGNCQKIDRNVKKF